jgi:hypothetical protein
MTFLFRNWLIFTGDLPFLRLRNWFIFIDDIPFFFFSQLYTRTKSFSFFKDQNKIPFQGIFLKQTLFFRCSCYVDEASNISSYIPLTTFKIWSNKAWEKYIVKTIFYIFFLAPRIFLPFGPLISFSFYLVLCHCLHTFFMRRCWRKVTLLDLFFMLAYGP